MRIRAFTAVLVVAALALAGCGSAPPKPGNLIGEYAKDTHVKHDRIGQGGTSGDRLANIAAHFSVEQLATALLSAYECTGDEPDASGQLMKSPCRVNLTIEDAAKEAVGDNDLYGRSIVVKHPDKSLELITIYVAKAKHHGAVLVDPAGDTYDDLTDFREHNDILTSDDWMLTAHDLTALSPKERNTIDTVTGHTPSSWGWWAAGGLAVALAAAGVLWLANLRRRGAVAEG